MMETTREVLEVKEQNFTLEFEAENAIDAQELGELLSSLAALYSRIVWINDSDANHKRFKIDPSSDASVWYQAKPIIREIQRDFIDTIVSGIQSPIYSFDANKAVQLYLFRDQFGLNEWPVSVPLNISSISFNSPLKMNLKGTLSLLIILTCIGGGEFSFGGKDGIHVQMPGIGGTIKTIHETIFPRKDEEFQEELKRVMQRQAAANTNMILDLDRI